MLKIVMTPHPSKNRAGMKTRLVGFDLRKAPVGRERAGILATLPGAASPSLVFS
jgi:hypothetical protein